jgi:hypothetical protein
VRSEAPARLPGQFSEQVADSLAKVGKAISETSTESERGEATSSPEYQEIMLLKVKLEVESARILAEAGRLGRELVEAANGLRERAGEDRR